MRAALALALVGAAAGCVTQTELLPGLVDTADLGGAGTDGNPAADDGGPGGDDGGIGCPLQVDVFGPSDTLFPGCQGISGGAAANPSGYVDPGATDYKQSLAGRINAALAARFPARQFTVRACGAPDQYLSSLTDLPESVVCGSPSAPPSLGRYAGHGHVPCADDPASFVVLIASEPFDRCHGGDYGKNPPPRRQDVYEAEFLARLDRFLENRRALLAAAGKPPLRFMLGAQTEWTPLPSPDHNDNACTWERGDWSVTAISHWVAAHPAVTPAEVVSDLHQLFKFNCPWCCNALNFDNCPADGALPWIDEQGGMGPSQTEVITCEGASQIAGLWTAAVAARLADKPFRCGTP